MFIRTLHFFAYDSRGFSRTVNLVRLDDLELRLIESGAEIAARDFAYFILAITRIYEMKMIGESEREGKGWRGGSSRNLRSGMREVAIEHL